MWRGICLSVRTLFQRKLVDKELDEELQLYLDAAVQEKTREGMSYRDALRAVRVEVGSTEAIKEKVRTVGWEHAIVGFGKDLRFGARQIRKAPAFSAAVVITLALGIGASTSIFTIIRSVLLQPLPFESPSRLVDIREIENRNGVVAFSRMSYPDFIDFRQRNRVLENIASYYVTNLSVVAKGRPREASVAIVSADLFKVLGIEPVIGHSFERNNEQPGRDVAMLSYTVWKSDYAGEADILGRNILVDGKICTIIGVAPRGFSFPISAAPIDIWITLAFDAENTGAASEPMAIERGARTLGVVARLEPRVTLEQAQADLNSIAEALATEYPRTNRYLDSVQLRTELESVIGDSKSTLWLLSAAVAIVLIISCVNVAGLLLARGATRAKEIAVRAAIGATRFRLIRQLIVESVLLSLFGAALGVIAAKWAVIGFVSLYPSNLPRIHEVEIDPIVLFFTVVLGICSGIVAGVIPAIRLSNPQLEQTLRGSGRSVGLGPRERRLHSAFIVTETALGVILLMGAGLLLRSFQHVSEVNPGFKSANVLTARWDIPSHLYSDDAEVRLIRELFSRLNNEPGLVSAAGVVPLPFDGSNAQIAFQIERHPLAAAARPRAAFFVVTPEYFKTLAIPLLSGRTFDAGDTQHSKAVIIISRQFARRYLADRDPIGTHISPAATDVNGAQPMREIIGVVGDVLSTNLKGSPEPSIYVPVSQVAWGAPCILLRAQHDPITWVSRIRATVQEIDPTLPVYNIRPMEDYLALSLGRERFGTILLVIFASLALFLTAMGLYALISYTAAQRTHEIGVRLALGASTGSVFRSVCGHGLRLVGYGLCIGLCAVLLCGRFLNSILFETKPFDAVTLLIVCLLLVGVSALATYFPALKATRVHPMEALRQE